MRKFKFEFETVRFPLVIMLIMFFLRGFSNLMLSSLIKPNLGGSLNWLIVLFEIMLYFSAMIIQYLPFLIVNKYLSKKYDTTRITLMYIISYIILLTVTMILGKDGLPSVVYTSLFNIQMKPDLINGETLFMFTPFRIGLIGALTSGVIVNYAYKITRSRTKYALLKFIDKDVLSLLLIVIFTIVFGVIFTLIWPVVIGVLFSIFEWIGRDLSNPLNTMVYGFFDKILSLFDLSAINRQTFWSSNLGGTWMNSQGVNFVGDVPIWNAQMQEGLVNTGFGRYITPYYVINLFALPGIVCGLYSTYTNKKERRSQISLLILIIVFMIFSDQSITIEMFLIFMAPLLYVIHVALSSLIFGLLEGFNLYLGSSLITSTEANSLGNGYELMSFLKNDSLFATVISVITIGVVVFILYYFLTRLYYKFLAYGLINKYEIDELTEEVLEIVGGLDNIKEIDSNPFRIEVKLNRPQLFDYERLEETKVSRVIETRSIYALYYGSSSGIIRKEILLKKKLFSEEE